MFKNLVKKIKGAAKKIAPYAGVIAGAFGAGPWMSAGIGALGGGLGTGNAKGAVLGGLGGYGAGTMWGGRAGYPGGNRLFGNPLNIFNKDKAFFNPDQVANIGDLVMGNRFPVNPDPNLIGPPEMSTGLGRFKDFLTMEKNPLTGNALKEGSMYRFLPAAATGTALAYGLGAFDEEPVPEDQIPKEYVYDAATDPLKNVNKRFRDYYQGITQVAPSSIYGYLQSIGALKEGGVPRGYSGGGSITPEMDIPGQFLLNNPSKTPLSVLEAADGVNTSEDMEEDIAARLADFKLNNPPSVGGIQGLESYVDTGEGEGIDRGIGAAKDVLQMGAEEAIKELGTTGRSIGPAGASTVSDDGKRMLDLTRGQQEAVRDGATQVEMTDNQEKFYAAPPPDPRDPEDQTMILNNMVFRMLHDPDRIEKLSMEGDEDYLRKYNFTLTPDEQFQIGRQFAKEAGISTDDPRFEDIMSIIITESENIGNIKKEGAQPLFNKLIKKFFPKNANGGNPTETIDLEADTFESLISLLMRSGMSREEAIKYHESVKGKANGGLASFNYGGQIMGPGSGREDVIPGKIVDKNTGQTSDMLVSNNEHIIPEYALYAMGGGDTKKGHDMMDALRKQTKPMAQKMGYDFSGAEDGSVMYG